MSGKEDDFDWNSMQQQMQMMAGFSSFGKQKAAPKKITKVTFDKSQRTTARAISSKETTVDDTGKDDNTATANNGATDKDDIVLPISHEIVLKDHSHIVTSLSIDPSGSRIVSGGRDEYVKCWDFNGMDAAYKPFLQIDQIAGG